MVDRAVVALEVVLERDLPVGLDLVRDPAVEPQRVDVEPVLGDDLRQVAERARTAARRVGSGIGEHERSPGADRDRHEPHAGRNRTPGPRRARRGPQAAVETVGPGVVRALQRAPLARRRRDDRAAVAADVDKAPQLRRRASRVIDDRHRPGFRREVAAGALRARRDGRRTASERRKIRSISSGQDRRVGVPGPRHRRAAGTRCDAGSLIVITFRRAEIGACTYGRGPGRRPRTRRASTSRGNARRRRSSCWWPGCACSSPGARASPSTSQTHRGRQRVTFDDPVAS